MYDTTSTRVIRGILLTIGIGIALLFFLFPIYWIVLTSFKTKLDALNSVPLHIGMFVPTLENYTAILGLAKPPPGASGNPGEYLDRLRNSIIIAGGSTVLAILFGTLTAYAMARFRIPGKSDILFYILS